MYTEAPPFGRLCLASVDDVPRIGLVAAAGFRYSQVFRFMRPHHDQYPEDTIASYRDIYKWRIRNPAYIVLVAVDSYDPDEAKKVGSGTAAGRGKGRGGGTGPDTDAVGGAPSEEAAAPDGRSTVVVGIASWRLEPGSKREGQFQGQAQGINLGVSGAPSRDENPERVRRIGEVIKTAESRYLPNHDMVDTIVVHPAYWGRGHGSELVRWGMRLAEMDQVRQGVLAAVMGEPLFLSLGFEKITDVHVDGDAENPEGIDMAVARYIPPSAPRQDD